MNEEKRGTGSRTQDEAAWWRITRWAQKHQKERGDKVIPDEVAAERIKDLLDKRYGTET